MSKKKQNQKAMANRLKRLEEENFKIRLASQRMLQLAEAKYLKLVAENERLINELKGDL